VGLRQFGNRGRFLVISAIPRTSPEVPTHRQSAHSEGDKPKMAWRSASFNSHAIRSRNSRRSIGNTPVPLGPIGGQMLSRFPKCPKWIERKSKADGTQGRNHAKSPIIIPNQFHRRCDKSHISKSQWSIPVFDDRRYPIHDFQSREFGKVFNQVED
jgi:hypothetical protein